MRLQARLMAYFPDAHFQGVAKALNTQNRVWGDVTVCMCKEQTGILL